jgi:hypothetical protein
VTAVGAYDVARPLRGLSANWNKTLKSEEADLQGTKGVFLGEAQSALLASGTLGTLPARFRHAS